MATWIVEVLGDMITAAASAEYFAFVTNLQLFVITVFMLAFSVFIVFLGACIFGRLKIRGFYRYSSVRSRTGDIHGAHGTLFSQQ
jgi:hypothetical protein